MAIPGYSSATDVTTAENAVATFELKESNVSENPASSLFESFQSGLESVGASSSFASFRAKKTKPRVAPSAGTQEDQVLAAPIPKDVGTIRVGTFNVENLFSRFEFKKTSKPDFGNQDLKRSLTEDAAKRITAQAIRKLNADVLALEEVEDIQTLNFFVDQYLADQGYEHRYLIEGNDPRGIDVALISRLPIVHLRSYKNDKNAAGQFIFSRDCLEVSVQDPASKKEFMLYINHFKSMAGGREETSPKRRAQCARVISILKDNHGPNLDQGKPFIVLGDFNDYVDKNNQNDSVWELVVGTGLVNPVEFLPEQEQWTHFYAKEREYHQLDFLLLSHTLQRGEQTPILVRAGQPLRATRVVEQRFSGVGQDRPKASDHCPLAYDIVL